jgi:hypothetical protein
MFIEENQGMKKVVRAGPISKHSTDESTEVYIADIIRNSPQCEFLWTVNYPENINFGRSKKEVFGVFYKKPIKSTYKGIKRSIDSSSTDNDLINNSQTSHGGTESIFTTTNGQIPPTRYDFGESSMQNPSNTYYYNQMVAEGQTPLANTFGSYEN